MKPAEKRRIPPDETWEETGKNHLQFGPTPMGGCFFCGPPMLCVRARTCAGL